MMATMLQPTYPVARGVWRSPAPHRPTPNTKQSLLCYGMVCLQHWGSTTICVSPAARTTKIPTPPHPFFVAQNSLPHFFHLAQNSLLHFLLHPKLTPPNFTPPKTHSPIFTPPKTHSPIVRLPWPLCGDGMWSQHLMLACSTCIRCP